MRNTLTTLSQKLRKLSLKKLILFSLPLLFLFLLLILFLFQSQKSSPAPPSLSPSPSPLLQTTKSTPPSLLADWAWTTSPQQTTPPRQPSDGQAAARKRPEISYKNTQISLPQAPPPLLKLRSRSRTEVEKIARRLLGTFQIRQNGHLLIFENLTPSPKSGLLLFNEKTGQIAFRSLAPARPSNMAAAPNPQALASSFLKKLNLADAYLSPFATYQKSSLPEITFVEFHRVPKGDLNLPILSPVALFAQNNQPLNTLTPGLSPSAPILGFDPEIINTSDQTDGLGRTDDFNTVTVGLSSDGSLYSLQVNLRPLKEKIPLSKNSSLQLKNLAQAKKDFSKEEALFTLNLSQTPQNSRVQKIEVERIELAYFEKPIFLSQKFLQPAFVFRGRKILRDGQVFNFAQAVPAVAASQGESLKLGTFLPPTSPPTPQPPTSSPPPQTSEPSDCIPADWLVVSINGLGRVATGNYTFTPPTGPGTRPGQKPQPTTRRVVVLLDYKPHLGEIGILSPLRQALGEQMAILSAQKLLTFQNLPNFASVREILDFIHNHPQDFPAISYLHSLSQGTSGRAESEILLSLRQTLETHLSSLSTLASQAPVFPMRSLQDTIGIKNLHHNFLLRREVKIGYCSFIAVSTTSPAIFIFHPPKGETLTLKPTHHTILASPALKNNQWQYKTEALPPFFYYEYDSSKVKLPQPKNFKIYSQKNLLASLEKDLFSRLNLPQPALDFWKEEIKAGLANWRAQQANKLTSKQWILVSLLSEKDLKTSLPLQISPKPQSLKRLHLYLQPLDKPCLLDALKIRCLKQQTANEGSLKGGEQLRIKENTYQVLELGLYLPTP